MKRFSLPFNILFAGLIAGTLDILAAIFILAGGNAAGTLKYIAGGAFGKSASEGGFEMAAFGLLFHYIIALSWTAAFFLLYPRLPFLRRNKWFNAFAYGFIVQTLMFSIVVPLSKIQQRPFNPWSFAENAVILIFTIGFPVALLADRFYSNDENAV